MSNDTTFPLTFPARFEKIQKFLPESDKRDPVETIIEILEKTAEMQRSLETTTVESGSTQVVESGETLSSDTYLVEGTVLNEGTVQSADGIKTWTLEPPSVYRWSDVAQKERGPGHGQPAELYILKETTQDQTPFDAEGSHVVETGSITIFCYSYDRHETNQYNRDVTRFLEEYMRDNYQRTNLHQLEGEESNDFRAEHITSTTDYFVESHTVGYRNLRDSGL